MLPDPSAITAVAQDTRVESATRAVIVTRVATTAIGAAYQASVASTQGRVDRTFDKRGKLAMPANCWHGSKKGCFEDTPEADSMTSV
jgi:hypothetical protein